MVNYVHTPALDNPEDTKRALLELTKRVENLEIVVQHMFSAGKGEPPKPRENMVAYADGTNWDPGDGPGLYKYLSGSWVHL